MTDFLFVYGTLMRAASRSELGRDMRARLEKEARWVGSATTAGRLLDLGAYPALAAANRPEDRVHGEVWELAHPATTFAWLDPYEGLESGKLRGAEYERAVRRIKLADGLSLDAQIYLYVGQLPAGRPAPEGRWHPPEE